MLYPGRRWYFFLFALFLWHIEKDTWALEDLWWFTQAQECTPSTPMLWKIQGTAKNGMVGNYRDGGVEELTKGAPNVQVVAKLKTR